MKHKSYDYKLSAVNYYLEQCVFYTFEDYKPPKAVQYSRV